jgi:hypothetical protein
MKQFDDDMDELFNRAGRLYPLKTEPKNWDAINSALHGETGTAAEPKKKTGFRRYLPLLLLLLIPAAYVFIDRENTVDKENIKNSPVTNNDQAVTNKQPVVKQPATNDSKQPSTVGSDDKKRDHEVKQLSYVPPSKLSLNDVRKEKEESGYVKGGLSGPPRAGNKLNNQPSGRATTGNEATNQKELSTRSRVNKTNLLTPVNNISGGPDSWILFPPLADAYDKPYNDFEAQAKSKTLTEPLSLSQSVPNSKIKNKNKKGFYYGVVAAPDFSMVKGQDIKGSGYSAGIVTGYRLNNHWSLEAGVLYSKKKYFTDGKYFNKWGAGIPSYINIYWLDGGCNMFEFPVMVKYDFSPKKNTFFGALGVTSYMMKKEDYKYSADAGVGGGSYIGHRSYDRSGDHLFANLQISAGYKYNLSPKLNIRIEPYLKAPLKKIGVGKMPITSAGLFFGITRDIR